MRKIKISKILNSKIVIEKLSKCEFNSVEFDSCGIDLNIMNYLSNIDLIEIIFKRCYIEYCTIERKINTMNLYMAGSRNKDGNKLFEERFMKDNFNMNNIVFLVIKTYDSEFSLDYIFSNHLFDFNKKIKLKKLYIDIDFKKDFNLNKFMDADIIKKFDNLEVVSIINFQENNIEVFNNLKKLNILDLDLIINNFDEKPPNIDSIIKSPNSNVKNLYLRITTDYDVNEYVNKIIPKYTNLETAFIKHFTEYDSHNMYFDISTFSETKELKSIELVGFQEIKNFDYIKKLKKLHTLYISFGGRIKIKNFDKLLEMKNITKIVVSCQLSTENTKILFTYFEQNKNLRSIMFRSNRNEEYRCNTLSTDNLEFLLNCTKLKTLFLPSEPKLFSGKLRYCNNLQNLTFLSIAENKIKDISAVQYLHNLKVLSIHTNCISDLSSLKNLSKLEQLVCYKNNIKTLKYLKKLKNLRKIDCSHNKIVSLSPIKNLRNLTYINCASNPIKKFNLKSKKLEYVEMHVDKIKKINVNSNYSRLQITGKILNNIKSSCILLKFRYRYESYFYKRVKNKFVRFIMSSC